MAYNRINKLQLYQKIQEITKREYEMGYNTLKGVWSKHIYPVYMISYKHYLRILAEGGLRERIEKEKKKYIRKESCLKKKKRDKKRKRRKKERLFFSVFWSYRFFEGSLMGRLDERGCRYNALRIECSRNRNNQKKRTCE